jgi:4-hydroxy-2-oxoheptanedioate aldolase
VPVISIDSGRPCQRMDVPAVACSWRHGILLCRADAPGAGCAFVERCGSRRTAPPRRPRQPDRRPHLGRDDGCREGRRVAQWKGELPLGLKLEDKYALENAEANAKIPGVAFAEWGPGDMAFSLGVKSGPNSVNDPLMKAARARVLAATKASKIFFLNSMNADNVVDMIKEGVMVGPASQQAAEIGRKYTKRTLPW